MISSFPTSVELVRVADLAVHRGLRDDAATSTFPATSPGAENRPRSSETASARHVLQLSSSIMVIPLRWRRTPRVAEGSSALTRPSRGAAASSLRSFSAAKPFRRSNAGCRARVFALARTGSLAGRALERRPSLRSVDAVSRSTSSSGIRSGRPQTDAATLAPATGLPSGPMTLNRVDDAGSSFSVIG